MMIANALYNKCEYIIFCVWWQFSFKSSCVFSRPLHWIFDVFCEFFSPSDLPDQRPLCALGPPELQIKHSSTGVYVCMYHPRSGVQTHMKNEACVLCDAEVWIPGQDWSWSFLKLLTGFLWPSAPACTDRAASKVPLSAEQTLNFKWQLHYMFTETNLPPHPEASCVSVKGN